MYNETRGLVNSTISVSESVLMKYKCFVPIFLLSANSALLHASSYDDCILENLKGVGSDVATMEIMRACRNKYKDTSVKPIHNARSDVEALNLALDIYRLDNYTYPTQEQGLRALVSKPTTHPVPQNWKAGGYIKKLYPDPWGNQYQYSNPGINCDVNVYTLGADGTRGGNGVNSDIGNWMLDGDCGE